MTDRESADEIEEMAARYVVRRDRDPHDGELGAELAAWLAADTRRQGAYLQAEAAWALLDREATASVADTVRPSAREQRHVPRRSLLVGGGAAIAASVVGVAIVTLSGEQYGTKVGEIRRIPLNDGSTAAINTQSLVEVAMTPELRRVKLSRGEAWFQVAKAPDRPFVVEAGRVRVRAVGTAFSVRRRQDGADVLVTEGVVEAWIVGAEGHTVRVAAGGKAFVAYNAAINETVAGPSELDRALAWRSGKIDLAGETLAHAVNEFNRYNARQLIIDDPAAAGQRLYGVFRTDDPDGFAQAVRQSLGVPVSFGEPSVIRIGATPG